MSVNLQYNLNELDTLLADLNSAKYNVELDNRNSTCDYYSDVEAINHQIENRSTSELSSFVSRKPKRPPKLMHILKDGEKNKIHDLAKENRDFDSLDIEITDEGDYGDYISKWEYLGKGIWENQDYGSISNYSTLKTQRGDYDYDTLTKSTLQNVSEDELEKATGAGPRGERSKFIPTDHGEVKSKYHYLGFGLWENTDPAANIKPKKTGPPPLPPKAEPVWYNCTVAVSSNLSSKELDDIDNEDFFYLENRDIEIQQENQIQMLDEPFEQFFKEDMSDMFRRAMLEKMNLSDKDHRKKYICSVCNQYIQGKIVTAMARKYHPECFVCTYCQKVFKDKLFKTDPTDGNPYCITCFEKLLGHYGNAHGSC